MKLKFVSLASGSSGNCYYLGNAQYGILIDAGIGIRTIKKVLKDLDIDFGQILAVLITHDHADHIKTVGCLGEKYNIPVYTTEGVHNGIDKSRYVEETLYGSRRIIEKEVPFFIRDFKVTSFEVPHDSTDNVGYHIEYDNHRFTFATDVGHITETVSRYMSMANHLIIEANYDEEMLRFGSYPAFLKERVASPTGHLSNREAAEFLATHYTPDLKDIWLCHLSKDNNHPELAYKTIDIRLFQEGIRVGKDVNLTALKRTTPSEVFEFD
ncbi:phosphoribosyl 1,2-cyclic phosphodiesterase [Parabacteroides sp. PFB2-12]|uniref:MBL fold metallo-hydrolase n=1 Tax=unclassified Parabacteroides TaxID=2649774 RepID=UPI00247487D5|nr:MULTISPECIES: MBL fold metallo-hydrolase [unclassified Parabacteroides]MDH6344255.1 phosphoribosyl 1,2-cyclic phosphodiesterase [Parabacteroides sp. PM6-13]MDH6391170.1 phosphoribosyl 1,2-cyclic phosphodiesterase [Parabacteroides sp. PFB2-12]